jgi:hypothetical protein
LGNFALLAYSQPQWQIIVPQLLLTNMLQARSHGSGRGEGDPQAGVKRWPARSYFA